MAIASYEPTDLRRLLENSNFLSLPNNFATLGALYSFASLFLLLIFKISFLSWVNLIHFLSQFMNLSLCTSLGGCFYHYRLVWVNLYLWASLFCWSWYSCLRVETSFWATLPNHFYSNLLRSFLAFVEYQLILIDHAFLNSLFACFLDFLYLSYHSQSSANANLYTVAPSSSVAWEEQGLSPTYLYQSFLAVVETFQIEPGWGHCSLGSLSEIETEPKQALTRLGASAHLIT